MAKNKKPTITPVWINGVWTYTMPKSVKVGQHCLIRLSNRKYRKVIMPKKRTSKVMYVPWKDNMTFRESGFSKMNGILLDKADPDKSAY